MIKLNFLKWWQTIKTFWAFQTTYRFNLLMITVAPALVFFFVKYNLWTSIYTQGGDDLIIKGYTLSAMLQYHIWTLVATLLGKTYFSTNLSEDIRMGKISSYLIYPFNFWEFHTAGWIAHQGIQIIITVVTVLILSLSGLLPHFDVYTFILGTIYTSIVGLFWFILQYLIGILSFWLEETWMLRVIANIVVNFLSGAVLPLDLFPSWLVSVLHYTPFPYLTYYPVKVFMGELPLEFSAIAVTMFWTILVAILSNIVWKRGLRLYTAAGM